MLPTLQSRTMELKWVVAVVVAVVVAFFAYQWYTVATNKKPKDRVVRPIGPDTAVAAANPEPVRPEQYPTVAGQTEGELRQKEPNQRSQLASQQPPATNDGKAPAEFDENLRRPEQSFHQPGPSPTLNVSDLPSGRAVQQTGQGFSPEMAQNDGPMIGNSVFAFDGMEPTGFANF